jgi:hypothetical protein
MKEPNFWQNQPPEKSKISYSFNQLRVLHGGLFIAKSIDYCGSSGFWPDDSSNLRKSGCKSIDCTIKYQ